MRVQDMLADIFGDAWKGDFKAALGGDFDLRAPDKCRCDFQGEEPEYDDEWFMGIEKQRCDDVFIFRKEFWEMMDENEFYDE